VTLHHLESQINERNDIILKFQNEIIELTAKISSLEDEIENLKIEKDNIYLKYQKKKAIV
jgi:peptidoglycan hydrolase CwlO-like protein